MHGYVRGVYSISGFVQFIAVFKQWQKSDLAVDTLQLRFSLDRYLIHANICSLQLRVAHYTRDWI